MMTTPLRSAHAHARAGAGIVIGQVGYLLEGGPDVISDALLADGRLDTLEGPVAATDVALGAASLIGKLLIDVEAVMGLDRGGTLANLGLWVARQETPHGL